MPLLVQKLRHMCVRCGTMFGNVYGFGLPGMGSRESSARRTVGSRIDADDDLRGMSKRKCCQFKR